MEHGFVKIWDELKGFGYIEITGQDDVFVHFSGIINDGGFKKLAVGDYVEFVVVEGIRGPQAAQVQVIDAPEVTETEAE